MKIENKQKVLSSAIENNSLSPLNTLKDGHTLSKLINPGFKKRLSSIVDKRAHEILEVLGYSDKNLYDFCEICKKIL